MPILGLLQKDKKREKKGKEGQGREKEATRKKKEMDFQKSV